MDLAKTNPRRIAALILNRQRQLNEVPLKQRRVVEKEVKVLAREQKRKEYNDAKTFPFAEVKKLYTKATGDKKQKKRAEMIEALLDVEFSPLMDDD